MTEIFEGFDPKPQSWDFPNIINGWVHKLSGSEFKVLWYILRHTYGWQKDTDCISLGQFQKGIKKRNGEWLDKGTGLSRRKIQDALQVLEKSGFILIVQIKNEKGQFSPNRYSVVYKNHSGENAIGVWQKTAVGKMPIQSLSNNNPYNNNILQSASPPAEDVDFINHFLALYEKQISKNGAVVNWGQSRRLAKPHLKKFGLDGLKKLLGHYLASNDQLYKDNAWSLTCFLSVKTIHKINALYGAR